MAKKKNHAKKNPTQTTEKNNQPDIKKENVSRKNDEPTENKTPAPPAADVKTQPEKTAPTVENPQTETQQPAAKKKKKRFTLKNEIQAILLSLAIGLTVCFFSPMDIFLGNQREGWIIEIPISQIVGISYPVGTERQNASVQRSALPVRCSADFKARES